MALKKHIPNAITCLNLFSGCIAAVYAFQGDLVSTAWFVYLAAIFDFLDGFAARGLKAYSAIGKELDSLADVVSFGFVPALVAYTLIKGTLAPDFPFAQWIPYVGFLIAVFSALRLAIFNLDERQTSSFIGLPTPANGLFWVSTAAWLQYKGLFVVLNTGFLLVLVVFFSFLLTSSLPMYSLKIKSLSFKENALPFILLISSVVFLYAFGFLGISLAITFYILSSFVVKIYNR